jgi:hypothetical protein
LLSYHYYKKLDFERFISSLAPLKVGIFIDSGAFSAFSQGSQIVLSEYAEYLRGCVPFVSHYANLDVIGDPEGTLENQRRLEDEGLSPIPVFHVGENFRYLERYCEEYDYVALGGMVPHLRFKSRLMSWLVKCFRTAEASPRRPGFHGFGCTNWDIVKTFPWRSVDSSSWGSGFRFGFVCVFDPRRGTWHQIDLGDPTGCKSQDRLIRSYGFSWLDFADRTRNSRKANAGIALASWLEAEKWLTKRHNTRSNGCDVYFVDTHLDRTGGPGDIRLATDTLRGDI